MEKGRSKRVGMLLAVVLLAVLMAPVPSHAAQLCTSTTSGTCTFQVIGSRLSFGAVGATTSSSPTATVSFTVSITDADSNTVTGCVATTAPRATACAHTNTFTGLVTGATYNCNFVSTTATVVARFCISST